MQTSLKSIEEQRAEARRQTEFIAETRSYVLELEQTLGRPLKSNVTTFGCQMNARDSEKIRGIFAAAGFQNTDN